MKKSEVKISLDCPFKTPSSSALCTINALYIQNNFAIKEAVHKMVGNHVKLGRSGRMRIYKFTDKELLYLGSGFKGQSKSFLFLQIILNGGRLSL